MSTPKQGIKDGKPTHYTVGAIIKKDEKYLLIHHKVYGYACVAGHIDEGEEPAQALVREVREESGLTVEDHQLVIDEFVPWNWCTKGVTGHHCYVYDCAVSGEVKQDTVETTSIGWYTLEEIRQLPLEPVWDMWFKKLVIL